MVTLSTEHLEHTTGDHNLGANYGNNLVADVELEIGGQRIDKHTGHYSMETWVQLTELTPRV